MNRLIKAGITCLLILVLCTSIAFAQTELFPSEGKYGEFPQIKTSETIYALPSGIRTAIEPLRVTDPYVTAGQPFIIEFTLENVGDDYGYPFNQIALSPDAYMLVMMADNQFDQVILPDGSTYDLWNNMSAWEQFSFGFATATDSFGSFVGQQLEGRQCGYVNIWTHIPPRLQNEITVKNGGKKPEALYNWSCIKLIDEAYFNQKARDFCKGTYDAKCLAEINNRTYVGDTVMVMLSSQVERGKCERVVDQGFWEALGGAITGRMNGVECGIGESGLKPGESVTISFVGLVPVDAPVLSPQQFTQVADIDEGVTTSASCINSDFPENCHTIYAGVYPLAKDNLIKLVTDSTLGQLIKAGNLIIGTLYSLDLEFAKDAVLTSGGITARVVGKPIYEARGVFYIVGAGLKGNVQIILMLAVFASFVTGASLARRTGGA